MSFGARMEPFYQKSQHQYNSCSSLTSLSASGSISRWSDSSYSGSVWSDASSQSSDDSSIYSDPHDTRSSPHRSIRAHACGNGYLAPVDWSIQQAKIRSEGEKHKFPKQGNQKLDTETESLPNLVYQPNTKVSFVESLVDSSAHIVEAIWPLSAAQHWIGTGLKDILPLRTFIQETLRRSRTSYSTLQVTLYYLILIKPHVQNHYATLGQLSSDQPFRALQCGRRMFLSALILASKYLQDRNYSARAWSKISGLNVLEINKNEINFLLAVKWKLHISDATFQRWTEIVLRHTSSIRKFSGDFISTGSEILHKWKTVITKLSPQLDNLDTLIISQTSAQTYTLPARDYYDRAIRNVTRDHNSSVPHLAPSVLEPSLSSTTAKLIAPEISVVPNRLKYVTRSQDSCHTALTKLSSCSCKNPPTKNLLIITAEKPHQKTLENSSTSPVIPHVLENLCQESLSKKTTIQCPSSSLAGNSQKNSSFRWWNSSKPSQTLISNMRSEGLQTGQKQGMANVNLIEHIQEQHGCEFIPQFKLSNVISPSKTSDANVLKEWYQRNNELPSSNPTKRCFSSQSYVRADNGSKHKTINEEALAGNYMEQLQRKRSITDLELSFTSNNNLNNQKLIDATSSDTVARKRMCCSVEASRSLPYNNFYSSYGRLGASGIRERL